MYERGNIMRETENEYLIERNEVENILINYTIKGQTQKAIGQNEFSNYVELISKRITKETLHSFNIDSTFRAGTWSNSGLSKAQIDKILKNAKFPVHIPKRGTANCIFDFKAAVEEYIELGNSAFNNYDVSEDFNEYYQDNITNKNSTSNFNVSTIIGGIIVVLIFLYILKNIAGKVLAGGILKYVVIIGIVLFIVKMLSNKQKVSKPSDNYRSKTNSFNFSQKTKNQNVKNKKSLGLLAVCGFMELVALSSFSCGETAVGIFFALVGVGIYKS